MRNNEEDQKIIELLEKLPPIQDNRTEDDIYQKVVNGTSKKRKKQWAYPSLVTVAVILFFTIITPLFIQQSNGKFMKMEHAKQQDISIVSEEKENISNEMKREMDKSEFEVADQSQMITTVYNKEDANDIITVGVVTTDAIVVPISIRAEDNNHDWLSSLREMLPLIDRERFGFKDISPLLLAMSYSEDPSTINVKITAENEDFFIENEKQIMDMIKYTVQSHNIDRVPFVNDQNKPVELGSIGKIPDLVLKDTSKKAYYLYKPLETNAIDYLVPYNVKSKHLSDAIASMSKAPNDFYQALIPKDITLLTTEEDGEVLITFNDKLFLDTGDTTAKVRIIEGILLTAKEYGYNTVKFKNIEPLKWEGFDFSKPIGVPYAINLIK